MVTLEKNVKKELIIISFLLLLTGCTNKESIGLEVPLVTSGCSGFSDSYSEYQFDNNSLLITSNIVGPNPCFKLTKAEVSKKGDNIGVYFTFSDDGSICIQCTGVYSLIYRITGDDVNRTGLNVTVIAYFNKTEVIHSFLT